MLCMLLLYVQMPFRWLLFHNLMAMKNRHQLGRSMANAVRQRQGGKWSANTALLNLLRDKCSGCQILAKMSC